MLNPERIALMESLAGVVESKRPIHLYVTPGRHVDARQKNYHSILAGQLVNNKFSWVKVHEYPQEGVKDKGLRNLKKAVLMLVKDLMSKAGEKTLKNPHADEALKQQIMDFRKLASKVKIVVEPNMATSAGKTYVSSYTLSLSPDPGDIPLHWQQAHQRSVSRDAFRRSDARRST